MSFKHTLIALSALAFGGIALAETPLAIPPLQAADTGMSRAEVRAELEMAQRAGLSQLQSAETYDPSSHEARQAQARYEQLRNGPEYRAALQRQQGRDRGARA